LAAAFLGIFGDEIELEDDDDRRTAGGGSSSPDGPDESLRKACWRFELFEGGGIETAVETVGFEGGSPVGVLARGINRRL
jgi:hypothetical protein